MSDFLKGRNFVIVPKVTTTERNALTATNGMLVYDSTLNQLYKYENGAWSSFAGGGGSASWGGITGTLSNQTDLQDALNAKQNSITDSIWGAFINALTSKTTPVDADAVSLMDSADSNKAKKLTWANIKSTLKTYFDGIYYAANSRITIASNLTTTSSSAADMTGIVTPTLDANSTYFFRGVFSVLSQSGGVKFAMTVPSGATGVVFATGRTTFTAAAQAAFSESGALSSTALAAYANSGTDAIITGSITTSSTAGVVQFRWASGTNTELSTLVADRTYLEIIKKP